MPFCEREEDQRIQAKTLEAIGTLEMTQRNERIMPWLESSSPEVRRAAVSALALYVEEAIGRAIEMLGDESSDVREMALERISEIGKGIVPSLLESLDSPKRALKVGILRILERLEVKDVELSEFITREVRQAYENISVMENLKVLEETPALGLLAHHLRDKNDDAVFTVFRILEVQGEGGKMRTIYRGVRAVGRERANALEALENTLHPTLSRLLIPLVEDISVEDKLKAAEKQFGIKKERPSDPSAVLAELLDSADAMTQMCTLSVIAQGRMEGFSEKLETLQSHTDWAVQETARQAVEGIRGIDHVGRGKPTPSIMDKIIHLQRIYVFSDLQVRELAAVSSVTVESNHLKDELVVREGEPGDSMFLIISGDFSVIQNHGTEREKLINTITAGDYFGEMALFEGKPRVATVKANTDAKLLVLGKREFEQIMGEFSRIPINICRVFSQRIRESDRKIQL